MCSTRGMRKDLPDSTALPLNSVDYFLVGSSLGRSREATGTDGAFPSLTDPRGVMVVVRNQVRIGRGGGDRTRPPIFKSRDLMALQPPPISIADSAD